MLFVAGSIQHIIQTIHSYIEISKTWLRFSQVLLKEASRTLMLVALCSLSLRSVAMWNSTRSPTNKVKSPTRSLSPYNISIDLFNWCNFYDSLLTKQKFNICFQKVSVFRCLIHHLFYRPFPIKR